MIRNKPGLEKQEVIDYFLSSIALDKNEVIMNILWTGCALPSSLSCEIEAGLIVSDQTLYLVEVVDPDENPAERMSWFGKKLPLKVVLSSPLVNISRVLVGIFDQSILITFSKKFSIKSFAVFPPTYEQSMNFLENLRAALDASGIQHKMHLTHELEKLTTREDNCVQIFNADMKDLARLKESLVKDDAMAKIGSFAATCSTEDFSLDKEILNTIETACTKFEITQFMVVRELSTDTIPVTSGKVNLQLKILILTPNMLYLCKEEVLLSLLEKTTSLKLPFHHSIVLDAHPIASVMKIKICDRAQPLASLSAPLYEFSVTFRASDDGLSGHSTSGVKEQSGLEWKLCVYDRQFLQQFFLCLNKLWQDISDDQLSVVHTTDPLTSIEEVHQIADTGALKSAGQTDSLNESPSSSFFQNSTLVEFCCLPHYKKVEYFKKHIAQAEFLKEDEVPLSIFMTYCSPSLENKVQIEACVVASSYGVYFISTLEGIQKWLNNGGASTFKRMSLLSKKNPMHPRCFYRFWINDLKSVSVFLFFLSIQLTLTNDQTIVLHTLNSSATLSLLNTFSSVVDLHNSQEEEEISEILSDYIDVTEELDGGGGGNPQRRQRKPSRVLVEFVLPPNHHLQQLRDRLVQGTPDAAKTASSVFCASNIHVLAQQVVLVPEDVRVRTTVTLQNRPNLLLLTNHGIYLCANEANAGSIPNVGHPALLCVKRWFHLDQVEHVLLAPHLSKQHSCTIHLRNTTKNFSFIAQTAELLDSFVHFLSLMWKVRSGKSLPVRQS